MPTRTDWPQDDFLAWLDATQARLNLASDYQLATHLGIGHTLISGWRNGRQRPSIRTLNKIASVLSEDPRRLWVLAGQANAVDVGLLDDDAHPVVQPAIPQEFRDLIDIYFDERLDERDREEVRRHASILAQTIEADLYAREEREQSNRRQQRDPGRSASSP